jgi:hypothetical protein
LRARARALAAGAAVAAGTYGCVFNPGIPCNGDVAGVSAGVYNNTVSKVMMPDDAKEEFDETDNVRTLQQTLPLSARDYLLVPLRPPCKITFKPSDLVGADTTCTNFNPRIRRDLGANADLVASLTQRNGGMNVRSTFLSLDPKPFDEAVFMRVSAGIMQVLDVIRQIGLHGGIHGDIKDVNMVYNATDHQVRIIDWGFFKFLSHDYARTRWENFDPQPPVMFNEMLSTWLYSVKPVNILPSLSSESVLVQWAHRQIAAWLKLQDIGHARMLDTMLEACSYSARMIGAPPFEIPASGVYRSLAPFPGLSGALTKLFVAHAVALLSAGFAERSPFFIDTVLRLNQDMFGALTAYCALGALSRLPLVVHRALYTVGRFLWDPKYAAEPFNVDEIKAAFAAIPGTASIVRPFPAARDLAANAAIMSALDPSGLRAFNSATYDVARGAVDDAYVKDQVWNAMKPASRARSGKRAGDSGGATASAPASGKRATTTASASASSAPAVPAAPAAPAAAASASAAAAPATATDSTIDQSMSSGCAIQ